MLALVEDFVESHLILFEDELRHIDSAWDRLRRFVVGPLRTARGHEVGRRHRPAGVRPRLRRPRGHRLLRGAGRSEDDDRSLLPVLTVPGETGVSV